ncbi:hypothetical protein BFJ71_g14578 [Fusarium oxysporum]|nr:hypothetical protein BFJ71_g14578 [Fusarium oxysporum]
MEQRCKLLVLPETATQPQYGDGKFAIIVGQHAVFQIKDIFAIPCIKSVADCVHHDLADCATDVQYWGS